MTSAASNEVGHLRGVGKETARQLAKLDIYTILDLLLHLPVRYQDRTRIVNLRDLKPGEETVVEGMITAISHPARGRTKLLCELSDGTGTLPLRFFHVFPHQARLLKTGTRLRCFGMVRGGFQGLEMMHPDYQILTEGVSLPVETRLTPIYPATEGLTQNQLRKLMASALAWMTDAPDCQEVLPHAAWQDVQLPTFQEALAFVHNPPQETSLLDLQQGKTMAQQRLIFEELLAHRLSLLHTKQQFQSQASLPFSSVSILTEAFLRQLPFPLTAAQARVNREIEQDLLRCSPMLRLVQGDVGSGKTVVAALAMLRAVESGYQALLMAPTELLAEQHYRVLETWLTPLKVKVVFLSGKIKGAARKTVLSSLKEGSAQIIVGTHALFQEEVCFSALALTVIDEQHRFGVYQRAALRDKSGPCPHQLMLTATPIPRTLAMSFYADMDCSVIDELPPGRKPILTRVLPNSRREEVVARIRETCQQGSQVYWVCPLIEESEVLAYQAVGQVAKDLRAQLQGLRIELIHGRLPAEEKEQAMRAFKEGEVQVLVATTVIEVGVDVPNATVMIIENAERMGLSQLHQLRGRVGRGDRASHCLLLYQQSLSEIAKERLAVMRETQDGFVIAQRDLLLRGPGELLGTRQTGEFVFRVADLIRDQAILPWVHQAAETLSQDAHKSRAELMLRWLKGSDKFDDCFLSVIC